MFKDGLARLCTNKYNAPTSSNLHSHYMHLTNYSLNKSSENFVDCQTTDDETNLKYLHQNTSSKRSIKTTLLQLQVQGVPILIEKFWNEVTEIVEKTLISMWPSLHSSYIRHFPNDELVDKSKTDSNMQSRPKPQRVSKPGTEQPTRPSFSTTYPGPPNINPQHQPCFHLLGFDIILDSNLKPWLLEVNAAPSMSTDSFIDKKIKIAVLEKTLQIVGLVEKESVVHTLYNQHKEDEVEKMEESKESEDHVVRRLSVTASKSERQLFLGKKEKPYDICCLSLAPGVSHSSLFVFSSSVLQRMYSTAQWRKYTIGMSLGSFNRVVSSYHLLHRSTLTTADTDLIYMRVLRRSNERVMSYWSFCHAVVLLSIGRYPTLSPIFALYTMLTDIQQQTTREKQEMIEFKQDNHQQHQQE